MSENIRMLGSSIVDLEIRKRLAQHSRGGKGTTGVSAVSSEPCLSDGNLSGSQDNLSGACENLCSKADQEMEPVFSYVFFEHAPLPGLGC